MNDIERKIREIKKKIEDTKKNISIIENKIDEIERDKKRGKIYNFKFLNVQYEGNITKVKDKIKKTKINGKNYYDLKKEKEELEEELKKLIEEDLDENIYKIKKVLCDSFGKKYIAELKDSVDLNGITIKDMAENSLKLVNDKGMKAEYKIIFLELKFDEKDGSGARVKNIRLWDDGIEKHIDEIIRIVSEIENFIMGLNDNGKTEYYDVGLIENLYVDLNKITIRGLYKPRKVGGGDRKNSYDKKSGRYRKENKFKLRDCDKKQNMNDNNCLLRILKFNNKEIKETVVEIREKTLNHNNIIKLDEIKIFEDYFKIKIKVYDLIGIIIYDDENNKNEDFIEIVLEDNHYYLLVEWYEEKINQKFFKREKIKYSYLFFDLETVFNNEEKKHISYSLSWKTIKDPNEWNKEDNECVCYKGYDCLTKLVMFLKESEENYIIVGYNSSKFDNFFLAEKCLDLEALGKIFYVNNSILGMTIDGKHKVFDLIKFTMTSLKTACEDFKTDPKKIEGFNHEIPQKEYEKGNLLEWIKENDKKIEEYNNTDVLCLISLYKKMSIVIRDMDEKILSDYMTIGQYTHMNWLEKLGERKNLVKKAKNKKDDEFHREGIIAGRCQCFEGKLRELNKEYYMVDVKSLYPTVMGCGNLIKPIYPIGDYKETDEYIKDKLGIYRCKILKQPEKNIIPKRDIKEKSLDWTYKGEIECVLCSVDIECIIEYKGEIEIYEGHYWEDYSDDIFYSACKKYVDEKNNQDGYKKHIEKICKKCEKCEACKKYNPALRQILKTMLNALYGRLLKRNFRNVTEIIRYVSDMKKAFDKIDFSEKVELFSCGQLMILKGTEIETKELKKNASPSYLGVFVLAYSRKYMYDNIISKYNLKYMDTDSALLDKNDYEKIKKDRPELFKLNSKGLLEFGQLEEELGDGEKDIYVLEPKNYLILCHKDIEEKKQIEFWKSKMKMKGISKESIYLTEKDMFENFKSLMYYEDSLVQESSSENIKIDIADYERYKSIKEKFEKIKIEYKKEIDEYKSIKTKFKNLKEEDNNYNEIKNEYKKSKLEYKKIEKLFTIRRHLTYKKNINGIEINFNSKYCEDFIIEHEDIKRILDNKLRYENNLIKLNENRSNNIDLYDKIYEGESIYVFMCQIKRKFGYLNNIKTKKKISEEKLKEYNLENSDELKDYKFEYNESKKENDSIFRIENVLMCKKIGK